jgi:FixJ family two-component response regulator
MRVDGTRVHLVRDDISGAQKFAEFLRSKGLSVVVFETAGDYIAERDDSGACLILDLNLPDCAGLELQSRLAGRGAPPVIFVTAHCDARSVVQAMRSGAIDVLIEPVDYDRLLASVRRALREEQKIRNERIERTCLLARWQSLTHRETEVFQHTVSGLLNKQAASELGIAENTYQVHRGRVMRKMNAQSLADLVRMSTILEPILWKPSQDDSTVSPRWSLDESAGARSIAFA